MDFICNLRRDCSRIWSRIHVQDVRTNCEPVIEETFRVALPKKNY